jgi:N-methylhydantoinase A
MRYRGQSYELPVELPNEKLTMEVLMETTARFHKAHAQLYGYAMENRPVEIVNLRLRAVHRTPKPLLKLLRGNPENGKASRPPRKVYFHGHGWLESPIFEREGLASPFKLAGPAVIEGRESTVVLMPKQSARVDEQGNLIIACGDLP